VIFYSKEEGVAVVVFQNTGFKKNYRWFQEQLSLVLE